MDSITVGYLYYIKDGDHPDNAEGSVTNTTFAQTTYQPQLLPFNQADDDNLSSLGLPLRLDFFSFFHISATQEMSVSGWASTGGRSRTQFQKPRYTGLLGAQPIC